MAVNPQEDFEDAYTHAFEGLFLGRGQKIHYIRDRARIDIAYQLNQLGTSDLSQTRVWFQLKGIHTAGLTADAIEGSTEVSLAGIELDHLRGWYAAPEVVYLVAYLEATNTFVGADVVDLVERQWGQNFLSNTALQSQQTTTVKIPTSATIDKERIDAMTRHRSMRIDGPTWRGRPLGHRIDPLRSALDVLSPIDFDALVRSLLETHQFRTEQELDVASLLDTEATNGSLLVGSLHNTWEWVWPGTTEIGFDPGTDFRIEGAPMHAQGNVAILVNAEVTQPVRPSMRNEETIRALQSAGIEQLLVFHNHNDFDGIGAYRSVAGPLFTMPQGLGSLAFNLLIAPLVYLDFRDRLKWQYVNYL